MHPCLPAWFHIHDADLVAACLSSVRSLPRSAICFCFFKDVFSDPVKDEVEQLMSVLMCGCVEENIALLQYAEELPDVVVFYDDIGT